MNIQQGRTSEFGYLPFVWMSNSTRLNSIHGRALRITYQDDTSTFQELLSKDNFVSIHHGNLQVLATEIFKIKNNIAPKIINETFQNMTSSYNLRKNSSFYVRKVHSVYYNTESLSLLCQKISELIPDDIKKSDRLHNF